MSCSVGAVRRLCTCMCLYLLPVCRSVPYLPFRVNFSLFRFTHTWLLLSSSRAKGSTARHVGDGRPLEHGRWAIGCGASDDSSRSKCEDQVAGKQPDAAREQQPGEGDGEGEVARRVRRERWWWPCRNMREKDARSSLRQHAALTAEIT